MRNNKRKFGGVMNKAHETDKSNRKSCVVPQLPTEGSLNGHIGTDSDAGNHGQEYRSQ